MLHQDCLDYHYRRLEDWEVLEFMGFNPDKISADEMTHLKKSGQFEFQKQELAYLQALEAAEEGGYEG